MNIQTHPRPPRGKTPAWRASELWENIAEEIEREEKEEEKEEEEEEEELTWVVMASSIVMMPPIWNVATVSLVARYF